MLAAHPPLFHLQKAVWLFICLYVWRFGGIKYENFIIKIIIPERPQVSLGSLLLLANVY